MYISGGRKVEKESYNMQDKIVHSTNIGTSLAVQCSGHRFDRSMIPSQEGSEGTFWVMVYYISEGLCATLNTHGNTD